jgi:hypothetical protein
LEIVSGDFSSELFTARISELEGQLASALSDVASSADALTTLTERNAVLETDISIRLPAVLPNTIADGDEFGGVKIDTGGKFANVRAQRQAQSVSFGKLVDPNRIPSYWSTSTYWAAGMVQTVLNTNVSAQATRVFTLAAGDHFQFVGAKGMVLILLNDPVGHPALELETLQVRHRDMREVWGESSIDHIDYMWGPAVDAGIAVRQNVLALDVLEGDIFKATVPVSLQVAGVSCYSGTVDDYFNHSALPIQ